MGISKIILLVMRMSKLSINLIYTSSPAFNAETSLLSPQSMIYNITKYSPKSITLSNSISLLLNDPYSTASLSYQKHRKSFPFHRHHFHLPPLFSNRITRVIRLNHKYDLIGSHL